MSPFLGSTVWGSGLWGRHPSFTWSHSTPVGTWGVVPKASKSWQLPCCLAQPLPKVSQVAWPWPAAAGVEGPEVPVPGPPGVAQGAGRPSLGQERSPRPGREGRSSASRPGLSPHSPRIRGRCPGEAGGRQLPRPARPCRTPEGLRLGDTESPHPGQTWGWGRGRRERPCLPVTRATGLSLSFPTATTPSKASVGTHQVKGGSFGPATVPARHSCSPHAPAAQVPLLCAHAPRHSRRHLAECLRHGGREAHTCVLSPGHAQPLDWVLSPPRLGS